MGFSLKKFKKTVTRVASFAVAPIKVGVTAPAKALTWAAAEATGSKALRNLDRAVGAEFRRDVKDVQVHAAVGASVGGAIAGGRLAGLGAQAGGILGGGTPKFSPTAAATPAGPTVADLRDPKPPPPAELEPETFGAWLRRIFGGSP